MDDVRNFINYTIAWSDRKQSYVLVVDPDEFERLLRQLVNAEDEMNNHQVALDELKTLYEYIKNTSETNPHDVVRLVVSTFVQRLEWVINKLENEDDNVN